MNLTYYSEEFTAEERAVLARFFTNLDYPVFALVNLPEVVKGALFARYSRTHKSLRRLFLDEFVDQLGVTPESDPEQLAAAMHRAEKLYQTVFYEYGDDSVAQLGGVHLACEQASNLLTKILEWGRLAAYLEQSTRYIPYDQRLGDRYRYCRPPEIMQSPLAQQYVELLNHVFGTYSALLPGVVEYYRAAMPKPLGASDAVYNRTIRAAAFDAVRGLLPASTLSNVGIYANGQAFESLLIRMNAHPLQESGQYSGMMLGELRKVIPSFMTRVDRPDRGGEWSAYIATTRAATQELAISLLAGLPQLDIEPEVRLLDFDPLAEDKLVAAILASAHPLLSEEQATLRVSELSTEDKLAVLRAYRGERRNRRHKPGRALERPRYRFEVVGDYAAFRDLQRHRMLTIHWQPLGTAHGYQTPSALTAAGLGGLYEQEMEAAGNLHRQLLNYVPRDAAAYAVPMDYRLRYTIEANARELVHMIELRTAPAGHQNYRRVCQAMIRLIRNQAGHNAIADMMLHADMTDPDPLGRLDGEQRAESRRLSA
jgi:thymidylate synthase ThyX